MAMLESCHSCGAPCTAAANSPSKPRHPLPPVPKYYLHEHGGFNFSKVIGSFDKILQGSSPDRKIPVQDAQHLVDLPLIRALQQSPRRTYSRDDADVHLIGALPFASFILGDLEDKQSSAARSTGGGRRRHIRRMKELARSENLIKYKEEIKNRPKKEWFIGKGRRNDIAKESKGDLKSIKEKFEGQLGQQPRKKNKR